MNCEDFKKNLNNAAGNKNFEEHLKKCEFCRKEYELHSLLRVGAKELDEFQPPVSLWSRIEKELSEEAERKSNVRRLAENIKEFFFKPGVVYRPVAAAAVIVLMIVSGIYFFKPLTPFEKSRIQTESLVEIQKAQEHYLSAIASLTTLARENRKNIEPELFSMYREKLQLIEASIDECKKILNENELNTKAWNFLFASYQKKVNTLQEMANL